MAKRLTLDDRLKALITAAVGDEIDFEKIAAYESVAASTRPLNKPNSVFHGAIMSKEFLDGMVLSLQDETVPLHTMHEGHLLPVGKVFAAKVYPAEAGHYDLNSLFFVDAESSYARDLDLGIIDEVSIGAKPRMAFCSKCGFDYAAPGNEFNLMIRECDDGHVIGQEGVHLRLTEVDAWQELSLVGKGASNKPKILGSAKQRLSKESYDRLAASGQSPEAIELSYLLCSPTQTETGDPMDLQLLSDKVETLSTAKGKLETQLEASQSSLNAANEQITTLQTEKQALEAKLAAQDSEALTNKVTELETQLSSSAEIVAAFDEQLKLAATAAGLELAEDATNSQKLELLKQAQIKLAAIPRGGVMTPAGQPPEIAANYERNSAFLTK